MTRSWLGLRHTRRDTPKSHCYFCCFVALLLHAASHIAEMLMFGESIQKAQERQKQREREREKRFLSQCFLFMLVKWFLIDKC